MNLRDVAESAGLFAVHAGQIAAGPEPPQADRLYDYVSLSRRRLRLWMRALEEGGTVRGETPRTGSWVRLANEILVVELLTRVSAAVLTASDAHRNVPHARPFARHVYLDQLQAKQAVLSALVDRLPPLGAALRVNRLRRKTERWADFLIATLQPQAVVSEFAVDVDRSAEFRDSATAAARGNARDLMLVALRNSMPSEDIGDRTRDRVHTAVARLLVSLLPRTAYQSDGRLRSPAHHQLFNVGLLHDRVAGDEVAPCRARAVSSEEAAGFEVLSRRVRGGEDPRIDRE